MPRLLLMTFPSFAVGLSLLCAGLLGAAIPASAADPNPRIPTVHGATFSDAKVDLPADLQGKVGILVVGFSQGSRDAVTAWGKRLATDYYGSTTVLYYEMPMLASVPRLLRGFVEGRIKASVSDRGRAHFLPLTEDEPAWRALTHYSAPDDPYIMLVDGEGAIRWQTQGAPADSSYAALKQQVEGLRPR
jgi:hypothetical protein